MKTISYYDLAKRVGDMVRMNNITEFEEDLFDNVYCGDLYNEQEENEEETYPKEFYQYYAITQGGADYLKQYTDEVVFYSDKLDTYFWGITHFGTSWDGVETTLTTKTN